MNESLEERACELARYIIEQRGTVRSAAKHFGISKSTVHKDLTQRLPLNLGHSQSLCLLPVGGCL